MNWLDIIILVLLGFNFFKGLKRGLILSLFDILSIILATVLAIKWHHFGIELLTETLSLSSPLAYVISFALTWVAIFGVVSLIGAILYKFVAISFLRPFDIVGGGILGLIRGAIFGLLIIIPINSFPFLPSGVSGFLNNSIMVTAAKPLIDQNKDRFTPEFKYDNKWLKKNSGGLEAIEELADQALKNSELKDKKPLDLFKGFKPSKRDSIDLF
jgi:uncharacterized membrane protein required for colicin V production